MSEEIRACLKDMWIFLKALEGWHPDYPGTCDICRNTEKKGHHENCVVGILLKQIETIVKETK